MFEAVAKRPYCQLNVGMQKEVVVKKIAVIIAEAGEELTEVTHRATPEKIGRLPDVAGDTCVQPLSWRLWTWLVVRCSDRYAFVTLLAMAGATCV